VVKWNPCIDEVIEVDCLTESISVINEKRGDPANIIIDCHYNDKICLYANGVNINLNNPQINDRSYFDFGALLTSFCYIAGLPGLTDAPIFHQQPNIVVPPDLPQKYVVFHCKSAEDNKDWTGKKWILLAERIVGLGFGVVEVGLEPVINANCKGCYDCTGLNSLQLAAEVIKRSCCFIGIDSLFAHIANGLGVYGIMLLGKYRDFLRHMPYTGNYADGINSAIIYADDDGLARDISVDAVWGEFKYAEAKNFRQEE
jgi:ADP-heptose:LPS heptosyltransferase